MPEGKLTVAAAQISHVADLAVMEMDAEERARASHLHWQIVAACQIIEPVAQPVALPIH